MTTGMSAPPIGTHEEHAKQQRQDDEHREQRAVLIADDQIDTERKDHNEEKPVHRALQAVRQRTSRHQLLQLREGDQASGEAE